MYSIHYLCHDVSCSNIQLLELYRSNSVKDDVNVNLTKNVRPRVFILTFDHLSSEVAFTFILLLIRMTWFNLV